jgi:acetate kinase
MAGNEAATAQEKEPECGCAFGTGRRTGADKPIPIETSAHHVHLSEEHVRTLFGEGHRLVRASALSQPGQYACSQTVTVVGPTGSLENVRVVGPPRSETQVEISKSDQFALGLQAPIRESGDLAGSCGCILVGPAGRVVLDRGVICAMRHIHMSPADAIEFGVHDGSVVRVRIDGDREMIYGDVKVRVHPDFRLAMHLDTDEANAGNLGPGAFGFMEGIQPPEGEPGNRARPPTPSI